MRLPASLSPLCLCVNLYPLDKALNLHRIRAAEFTACAVVNPRQKKAIACATSQMKGAVNTGDQAGA